MSPGAGAGDVVLVVRASPLRLPGKATRRSISTPWCLGDDGERSLTN